MSWYTALLDNIIDAIVEVHRKARYPHATSSYEDDPQEELKPRPPDFKGDIPLHFNARPGEYEDKE